METGVDDPGNLDRLVSAARAGSGEALGGAIESLRPDLVFFARRELGRDVRARTSASDVVQETMIKAHRDFGGFHGQSAGEFRAWLIGILRHSLLEVQRHCRARKRDARQEEPDGGFSLPSHSTSPSGKAMKRERAALLATALGRLCERERSIVAWRHEEGRTFQEIGQRLGCSVVAARAAWLRAIEHLREELRILEE